MSKNTVIGLLSVIFLGLCLFLGMGVWKEKDKSLVVGVVVPMDHAALRVIVEAFKETLSKTFMQPVTVKVQNAQGDMNLQHSIIQQLINEKVAVVVPIGTAATQMALSMVKTQPIVSLAALDTQHERDAHQNIQLSGVLDEVGPKKPLDFMLAVFPHLKKITLVYSNTEKVFPEVQELLSYSLQKGVSIQKLMVHSLADLYTLSNAIDADSQAIFVLKDHLIVSGMPTLVQVAHKRQIPVIACDEGSVTQGATFALGVQEKNIGEAGAKMVAKLLNGVPMADLPVEQITELSVFYNTTAFKALGLDVSIVQKQALDHHYQWIAP